jgi:hypothetical protein
MLGRYKGKAMVMKTRPLRGRIGVQVGGVSRNEERVILQDKTTGWALLQWHLNVINAPLENLLDFPSR